MNTLIIYDNTGHIFMTISGSYTMPQGGIQYLETIIPTGKLITGVNTSVTPNIPIYEDIPLTETELLKQRIEEQETALIELADLLGGAV